MSSPIMLRIAVIVTLAVTSTFLAAPAVLAYTSGSYAYAQASSAIVPHSVMMAALIELQRRFPDRIVIGFEEIYGPPPNAEPIVDLGPPGVTLQAALERIRKLDARYKVELQPSGLLHVYPAHGTADHAGLLDIRSHEFFLPPDDCLKQQMCCYMDGAFGGPSYTPELGEYLWHKKEDRYRSHGKQIGGVVGDFLGDCLPAQHRRPPFYYNITVREALDLMALRSLQVARGEASSMGQGLKPKPISWHYRFRPDPGADTGLGGVPVFQTF